MNDHDEDPPSSGTPPDGAGDRAAGPDDRAAGPADVAAAQDLRATADAIRTDVRRLTAVEDRKEVLDPADARVDELSDEAVEIADRIQREARAERQLVDEIS
jgi:hypothetical protein